VRCGPEQVETDTSPCASLDGLVAQLVERRAAAGQAAHRMAHTLTVE
jgi:hypothetical protein